VTPDLGRVGIWSAELRFGEPAAVAEAARTLDELGFPAIWFPGGLDPDAMGRVDLLLDATENAVIGTGIVNVWKDSPEAVSSWWRGLPTDRQARVMLGLGVSHGPAIEEYNRPLAKMRDYLDGLDAGGVPTSHRCLAALGPKMLDLARDRTAGSHPFLGSVQHTAIARERLGPNALLAPELGVVLETDPDKARAIALQTLSLYFTLPNYVNNWRRLGFSEEQVTTGGDQLVDALFAWGDVERIKDRIAEHHAAGADHVCLQVLREPGGDAMPTDEWKRLAKALL